MILKWHEKTSFSQHVPLSITFSPQNCVKMKNLLSYDFEQGNVEYICKKIGTKSTKMIFLWRSKLTYAFSLLLLDMYALPRWQSHNYFELKVKISFKKRPSDICFRCKDIANLDFRGQRSSQISKIGHNFAMKANVGVIFFFFNDIFSLSQT